MWRTPLHRVLLVPHRLSLRILTEKYFMPVALITSSIVDNDIGSKSRWKLSLENFGKIESGSLDIAPLTVLVGRNNTGKSYAASMIWALLNFNWSAPKAARDSFTAPAWFVEKVRFATTEGRDIPFIIKANDVALSLNQWIDEFHNPIVENVLSLSSAKIGRAYVEFFDDIWLRNNSDIQSPFGDVGLNWTYHSWSIMNSPSASNEPTAQMLMGVDSEDKIIDALYKQVVEDFFVGVGNKSNAVYIPAARTGLMLTLPTIAASLMNNFTLEVEDRKQFLSLPTVRFLQSLLNKNIHGSYRPRTADVADFLESNILEGKVRQEDSPSELVYQPDNMDEALPMHAVSSMVSELAPILIMLRGSSSGGSIVLEEPESHLHLHAQRVMARAIARLVNMGVKVIITTHSDTFLQQINLLIQISASDRRDSLMNELDYQVCDLLNHNDVGVFEFVSRQGRTHIEKADCGKNGFIIESINETLSELATEVIEVNGDGH